MKTSMKTFLTDLYEIDPTLKTHEAEIIPLVEKLMKSDPAVEPDSAFVKRLRMQLKNRAAELSAPASAKFSRWLYAFGGALTAAVVIPVAFVAMNNMKPTLQMNDGTTIFSYSVKDEGKEAFGALSLISRDDMTSARPPQGKIMAVGGESMPSLATEVPAPQDVKTVTATARMEGVAANDMAVMPDSPVAAPAMTPPSIGIAPDAKMIAPYPMTTYSYVYEGELPTLSPSVAVYKRITAGTTVPYSALAKSLKLGNIDLGSFDGMSMDSVTFSQNKSFGYQMTINLRESSVSLDQQWNQWPQSKCTTDACFQAERVKLSDVPSEDQLIAAANAFIKDHGIDMTHYGTPSVDMQWKRDYDAAPSKNDAWIPDQMRVMYPVMIDGQAVSDQSGMPYGISVNVHTKLRKVVSVYGLMSRDYAKSEYAGVTDAKQITEYLSKLDQYGWAPEPGTKVQKATVTLGTPVMGYSVYYKYEADTTYELLIPSLTFPIQDVKGGEEYFYRRSVVIPLAAEMLTQQQDIGRPMPMDGAKAM